MSTRLGVLAATTLAAALAAPLARADVRACLDASERGQVLRDKGHLRDARASFVQCARDACPGVVRSDCATWLADVEERLPAVLVRARDAQGRDVVDVRTSIDGALVSDAADGRFLQVDPGVHTFRFERPGGVAVEQRVVVRERERDRILDVTLPSAPAAPAPPASKPSASPAPSPAETRVERPISALTYALGAIGVAGVGAFAVLAAVAKSDVDRMRGTCQPACSSTDVTSAKTELFVANASVALGAVALAAATWLFVTRPEVRTTVDVRAARSGGSLLVTHRF